VAIPRLLAQRQRHPNGRGCSKRSVDVFVDSHDNVFIADLGNPNTTPNNLVREVAGPTPGAGMTAGSIYTVAGVQGLNGPAVSGISAITAKLNGPEGLFVDAAGNLFSPTTVPRDPGSSGYNRRWHDRALSTPSLVRHSRLRW